MTRFDNSIPLKSLRSHLDTPGYLVGYIIVENNKVAVSTWEIIDLLPVLSNKVVCTLVNM